MKKRILCYGDSNTWGLIAGGGGRYPEDVRWTGVCQRALGEEYQILEDGINGRTTVYDTGRSPYQNGRTGLGFALLSQAPLDLVVLALGTNDLEFVSAGSIAVGMDELVRITMEADHIYRNPAPIFREVPRVLVAAPPLIDPDIDRSNPGNTVFGRSGEMKIVSPLYRNIAQNRGAWFIDCSEYGKASPVDGIHLDEESHRRFGLAMAQKIREILG